MKCLPEDAALLATWEISLVFATVVVLRVAVLALIILATAARIKRDALRALGAGGRVREHTMPLWHLETTNQVAGELLDASRSIRAHAEALAGALEH